MIHRVEEVNNELEEGNIMSGGRIGDRVLQMIAGGNIFPHIFKSNAKSLGGNESEEVKLPCRGKFQGTV